MIVRGATMSGPDVVDLIDLCSRYECELAASRDALEIGEHPTAVAEAITQVLVFHGVEKVRKYYNTTQGDE